MVLAETPQKGTDTLQLWTEVSKESLISKASLLYIDSAGQEVYNYEISPTGIKQYSPEPTPLDKTDLRDLRQDVIDAEWHEGESQECAASLIFFG